MTDQPYVSPAQIRIARADNPITPAHDLVAGRQGQAQDCAPRMPVEGRKAGPARSGNIDNRPLLYSLEMA